MAGFDAVGADHYFLYTALVHGPDLLQVRLETAFGDIVRVTDIAAHHRLFAADFTYF